MMTSEEKLRAMASWLKARGSDDQAAVIFTVYEGWIAMACGLNSQVAIQETGGEFESKGATMNDAVQRLQTELEKAGMPPLPAPAGDFQSESRTPAPDRNIDRR